MTHPDPPTASSGGFLRSARAVRVLIVGVSLLTAAAVILTFVTWPTKPSLAAERSGDRGLLAAVGEPQGLHRLSVAVLDLDGQPRVRFADIGATRDTRYEAGSLTKAMTGLALADAVERHELGLGDPVSAHLPLGDSAAGRVTLRQLATHSSGYPRLGASTLRRGRLAAFTAGNPYTATLPQMLTEARKAELGPSGRYAYSNLGAAVAGQATAAAAGLSYPELMSSRIFRPLGMADTVVAERTLVPSGQDASGHKMAPWVMRGYAPAGGMVTTSADLARFAQGVLAGTAPGLAALQPLAGTDDETTRIGIFWHVTARPGSTPIVWHNGQTGGYSSFVGFDLKQRRAVVVLSDVSVSVDQLAVRLLSQPA